MRVMYIVTKTRFDLLFAVSALACGQQVCSAKDEESLAQLVQYVKNTADWQYVISPANLTLRTSADASFNMHADARSHTGFVCTIGGTAIFARSVKQRLVTKSSTEAELIALNTAADETVYLRNLLTELGQPQIGATVIEQDNKSTIMMAQKSELGTKRTKHFTVRHYFIKSHLDEGNIQLSYYPGETLLADGLTKPLIGPAGRTWAKALLNGHDHFTT